MRVRACARKRSFKFMSDNYKKWLDTLKPYENSCKVCKNLVKRLERKMQTKNRLKSGCEVVYR